MSTTTTASDIAPISTGATGAPAQRTGSAALNFLQMIEQALDTLVTLKITTVIGVVRVDGEGTDTVVKLRNPEEGEGMMTEINLLNGKINNVISSSLATGPLATFRDFHSAQVERSQAIVLGNLGELQKLATSLLAPRR